MAITKLLGLVDAGRAAVAEQLQHAAGPKVSDRRICFARSSNAASKNADESGARDASAATALAV